jgi:hypothetical protein
MKIALCLSGQPRALEEGFRYWKNNLLDRYEVDVFVHSWDSHSNAQVLELYSPKAYLFEDYKFSPEHDKIYEKNCVHESSLPRYSLSQFYTIFKSRNIKIEYEISNKVTYDWVIKGRFDYALNLDLKFNERDNSFVYLPIRRYLRANNTYEYGFCDLFAFGPSDLMNKYMSVFEHIEKFSRKRRFKFYGEHLLSSTLIETGLRNHYGYPEYEEEKVRYVHMQDPFIGLPERDGKKWVYSLIRLSHEPRDFWLKHDLEYWNNKK